MPVIHSFKTHKIEPLPAPIELMRRLPLASEEKDFIEKSRRTICRILDGTDSRLILIVGPCSIHDLSAAKEYASRLQNLIEVFSDIFFIVMRAYFEKPRTALGWKGLLYDPHLDGSNDISTGMLWTRELLLDIAKMRIPIASEFLDPVSSRYFGDLVSWACIGARTSSSQIHRQMASGFPMPVAFKNSTDGNIKTAINGILTAQAKHSFIGLNDEGKISQIRTEGNPYGHLVLRGGETNSNYDQESIAKALRGLKNASLPPRVIVDCSHGNSNRNYELQAAVFESVLQQWNAGNQSIRGMILESHLHAGNQHFTKPLKYGVSLTDPCLDWESTRQLIAWGHAQKSKQTACLESILV